MHYITLLFLLFSFSTQLFAQDETTVEGWTLWYGQNQFAAQDVPNGLIKKQNHLATRPNAHVNCVGLAPDGGWVISYESKAYTDSKAYLSWEDTHQDFMQVLHPINDEGAAIQQIVFSPLAGYNNQTWLVLYDNNQANWKNLSPSLIKVILKLNQDNRSIKSIGLSANGGWVLIADNNEVFSELIPADLLAVIKELQEKKQQLKYISFNVDNGWILLFDKNGAVWDKVSESLVNEIRGLQKVDEEIRGVNFYTIKGKL